MVLGADEKRFVLEDNQCALDKFRPIALCHTVDAGDCSDQSTNAGVLTTPAATIDSITNCNLLVSQCSARGGQCYTSFSGTGTNSSNIENVHCVFSCAVIAPLH